MIEKQPQLELGLDFEAKLNLEAATESVTRQYLVDYRAGAINRDAWIKIAEVHQKLRRPIYRFWINIEGAWKAQDETDWDDLRFEYMESIKREPRQMDDLENNLVKENVRNNFALISDLLWARSPDYYSPADIREQLDIIYNEITPVAILDDDEGTIEHPGIAFPTELIIEKILKYEVSVSPSFMDESETN